MENTALLDRILTVEQGIAQSLFDVQIKTDKNIDNRGFVCYNMGRIRIGGAI